MGNVGTVEEQIAAIQARILEYEKRIDDLKGADYGKLEKEIVRLEALIKLLQEQIPGQPPKLDPPKTTAEKDPLASLIDGE